MVTCQDLIKNGDWHLAFAECWLATTPIIGIIPNFNPYDFRIKCVKQPLCYDFDDISNFLKRDDVKTALNVTDRNWT